ncbi:hypothetical protein OsJ_09445 [Oryza sativa Japonica Group]|uniref:DUF7811 domain-containing protein n=1 Tax=Oryza sativa subsp. japonica TaxID=39947 RepID=B9FBD5_ORYSJ|nr:hypothetical protein OsJ_09445 [Oryza sativa Japonica Group]
MADSAAAASSSLPRSLASRRPLPSSPLRGGRPRVSPPLPLRVPLAPPAASSSWEGRSRGSVWALPMGSVLGSHHWPRFCLFHFVRGFILAFMAWLYLGFNLCFLTDIQWVPEDRVTLFTSDGLVQIGGSLVPRRITPSEKRQRKVKGIQNIQRFQESSYMDPNQSLCLGALFNIAATNGLDMGRRLCIFGFCRSIEMLSDVVEDTVLEHGGEVVTAEKASKDGLQEKLTMSVAVPLLWGVPPASETLHVAVRSGGGIVEKIYWQWDLF